jgi:cobalt-zinc-cadmium efflux system protein
VSWVSGHAYEHTPPPADPHRLGRLGWTFGVTVALLAVQGGLAAWSRSWAVAGAAAHTLADAAAYALAYGAARAALAPPTPQRTYGNERSTVLAALANGVGLMVLGLLLAAGAVTQLWGRGGVPRPDGLWAGGGLGVAASAFMAWPFAHAKEMDPNERSVVLHVLLDAASSLAVLATAALLAWTHRGWLDPVAGAVLGVGVAVAAWRVVGETVHALMEGVPFDLDMQEVVQALQGVPGVRDVHHVHVWSMGAGGRNLSGHLVLADTSLRESQRVVEEAARRLRERFGIDHSTLQVEPEQPANASHGGGED